VIRIKAASLSVPLPGGLGGGGCISRVNPPDPLGMGDKSLQVSSIQTFSSHAALLPFPEPLGSRCSFSASPPRLGPCLSSVWSPRPGLPTSRQPLSIFLVQQNPAVREAFWGRAAVTRVMAELQAGREGDGESRHGPSGPRQRCLGYFGSPGQLFLPSALSSSGSEIQWWGNAAPPRDPSGNLQWGKRKPSALPALGMNRPLLSPDRPGGSGHSFPEEPLILSRPLSSLLCDDPGEDASDRGALESSSQPPPLAMPGGSSTSPVAWEQEGSFPNDCR